MTPNEHPFKDYVVKPLVTGYIFLACFVLGWRLAAAFYHAWPHLFAWIGGLVVISTLAWLIGLLILCCNEVNDGYEP
jgi:hypothetical protein